MNTHPSFSGNPPFFEIGARSNFSFLEGASHPEEMVLAAKIAGLSGLGIADRNSVAGVVRAHVIAKQHGYRFQPGARLVFSDEHARHPRLSAEPPGLGASLPVAKRRQSQRPKRVPANSSKPT